MPRWSKPAPGLLLCTTVIMATFVGIGFYRIYLDRTNLPDLEPFVRFDFPTIGHIYDTNGQSLMEMATEYRWISKYEDIPPVVCGAILAAEDKNFFSHNGVDYSSIPRMLGKLRFKSLLGRLTKLGRREAVNSSPIFPQGGSTITQQLVRGYFLQAVTARENSNQLRHSGLLARGLSYLIGARSVNMVVRKVEEIRLALWLEKEMQERFGSKRRAKEAILARYVSLVYMGNGQYGLARPRNTILAGVSPLSPRMMRTRQRCWQAPLSRLVTTRPLGAKSRGSGSAEIKYWGSWRRTGPLFQTS